MPHQTQLLPSLSSSPLLCKWQMLSAGFKSHYSSNGVILYIFCTAPKVCQGNRSDIFLYDLSYRHSPASCSPVSYSRTNVWSTLNRTKFYHCQARLNRRRRRRRKKKAILISSVKYIPLFLGVLKLHKDEA
jgi:hypothetical protein